MKQTENEKPHGEPILQTLAMPADTNPSGDILAVGYCRKWILLVR